MRSDSLNISEMLQEELTIGHQGNIRFYTAPIEPILNHNDNRNSSFEEQLEQFRRPHNRSMMSPYPPQNRDYLESSPISVNYYQHRRNQPIEEAYEVGEMHLDVTPLKPQGKYVKRKTHQSDQMLDFTEFQYPDQEQGRYQTPSRVDKPLQAVEQMPTASTIRNHTLQNKSQAPIQMQPKLIFSMPGKLTSIKGLRVLAEDVSRIVDSMKRTTYKEVAEVQIQKMESEGKISKNSKDSQNVKRRVYDALNVLISAGVLVRDGKFVCMDPTVSKGSSRNVRNDQRDKLQQQIAMTEQSISEKDAKLNSLHKRYLAHNYLVSRNKQARSMDPNIEGSKKIALPCIVLASQQGNYKCRLLRKTLRISSKDQNGIKIMGDLDIMVQLAFHRMSKVEVLDGNQVEQSQNGSI